MYVRNENASGLFNHDLHHQNKTIKIGIFVFRRVEEERYDIGKLKLFNT
jgi:hypothetical protein